MSAPSSLSDNSRYEQACDQAIAMCDGNLRSTIKALIMANEYLETELEELQAAISAGCVPGKSQQAATPPELSDHTGAMTMADVTYYVACHSCRTIAARRSRAQPRNARVRRPRCGAPK